MGKFKKAARGSILIFLGSILGSAFAYFFRMILVRRISVEAYGLFAAVFSFVMLFGIFRDLGIYSALTKYVAQALALKKESEVKKIVAVSIVSETLLAGVIVLVLKLVDDYLALNYFKQSFAQLVLNWMLVYFVLETVSTGFQYSFLGVQEAELFALKKPLFNIFSFVFVLLLPIKDARLPMMALTGGLGGTVAVLGYFFFHRFSPFLKLKLEDFKGFLPRLLRFGIPTAFASIGAMAIAQFDTLTLTYLRSLREVGVYNIVLSTALILGFIGDAVSRIILPIASEFEAKKEFAKIKDGLFTAYRFTLVPAILISLPLLLFPEYLLGLFFGGDYAIGGRTLQVLLIGVFFSIIGGVNLSTIYGLGYPKIGMKITLAAAFLNIILNLLLIPSFGIVGAAVATFFSFLTMAILSFRFLLRKIQLFFPVKFFFCLFLSWFTAFVLGKLGAKLFFENFALIWQTIIVSTTSGLVFLLVILYSGIFRITDLIKLFLIFK